MTESTKCPQCSGEMPANFPPGVCPACLLQQGMSPSTLTGAAGEGSGSGSNVGGRRHSWTPPTPAALAPRFPQLEIAELLGQGGMGAVYKVRQKELDRWAALKILPDEVASDPNFAERFQREARALAQLSHQHIVTVYEFGQRDGVFFLLMEFVDGVTLRQAGRAGQVAAQDALGIVTQLCDALQFAHEEGIVHRDIKPENILIDKRGRVKIADFGLAKLLGKQPNFPTLTGTHQIMGTPVYMAPEQMEGTKGVDHRADIFSLGVVFYELLTGELPLGRFAPPSQKYSLDVRLDEVVLRTLEKEPDRRYQQASDVRCDVESIRNQPAAVRAATLKQPRQSWSFAKMVLMASIIVTGTLAGLVGCFVILAWWSYASMQKSIVIVTDPQPPPNWTQSQQNAAAQQYVTEVQRQRLEREQQQQREEAARDPNEVNAVVQFTSAGVKLHPNAFGTAELTAEQRVALEKILNEVHQSYLKAEADHSQFATEDGTQTTTIGRFDDDLTKVENDLWTAVDTQLPIAVQKLLRQRLPLYADSNTPMPLVMHASSQDPFAGGGAGMMMAAPSAAMGSAMGGSPMSGMAGGMSAMGMSGTIATSNLRYQQLLGWKQTRLPLRITIRAQGKWRRWEIGAEGIGPPAIGPSGQTIYPKTYTVLDSGEAPELPSGLKRFWREAGSSGPHAAAIGFSFNSSNGDELAAPHDTPEVAFQRARQAFAARDWHKFADCFTDDARDELAFEHLIGATMVYALTEFAISSGAKQSQETLNRNSQFKQFVQSLEKTYPKVSLQSPETEAKMKAITEKLIQNRYSRIERRAIAAQCLRETFGNQSRDFFIRATEFFHSAFPDQGGFDDLLLQNDQQTTAFGTYTAKGSQKRLPIWFKRKDPGSGWKIDGLVDVSILNQSVVSEAQPTTPATEPKPTSTPSAASDENLSDENLDAKLLQMDKLRAADQTPWDEVEKLANELLAQHTRPADKGRIHWMAAHVYGQSDIRGQGADVIRHAKEALKYERDPVQRGWLYMYLGDATGLVQKKEEATRWYLKGYFELLAFDLPEKAPDLPTVGKFRGLVASPSENPNEENQIVFEVLQAAEVKARKEAELVRDLVSRRNIHIQQLQNLWGRDYVEGSDAEKVLKKLATEILREDATIMELIHAVWPKSDPLQKLSNGVNQT